LGIRVIAQLIGTALEKIGLWSCFADNLIL
jgi:hypothetical protein